jgi:hypothetical protein
MRFSCLVFALAALQGGAVVGAFAQTATTTTTTQTTTKTAPKPLTVLVDSKPVEFKTAQPQVVTGTTMVPLRGIFEAIGAYVEYDEVNHRISAHRNNESVDLLLGSRIAKKNGAEIMMEVKPQVIAGTTMVPLRFIAEALGAKVEFDKANNQILVTTEHDALGSTGG